jgi:hypothetical protein
MRIVVSEFMHDSAVVALGQRHAVLYDRTLAVLVAEKVAAALAAA